MLRAAVRAYHHLEEARPLVRPTYNQFEVALLPPFGDPEVHIPSELGAYVAAGLVVGAVTESLHDE